jgi:hypothetical protein
MKMMILDTCPPFGKEKKMDRIPRETEKRDLVRKTYCFMIHENETPGPAQDVLAN